jgi:hypothetical protein
MGSWISVSWSPQGTSGAVVCNNSNNPNDPRFATPFSWPVPPNYHCAELLAALTQFEKGAHVSTPWIVFAKVLLSTLCSLLSALCSLLSALRALLSALHWIAYAKVLRPLPFFACISFTACPASLALPTFSCYLPHDQCVHLSGENSHDYPFHCVQLSYCSEFQAKTVTITFDAPGVWNVDGEVLKHDGVFLFVLSVVVIVMVVGLEVI